MLIFNSLAPVRLNSMLRWAILKLMLVIVGWSISCEIDLRWISLDLIISMEGNGLVPSGNPFWISIVFYPSALRAGGVLSSRSGRAGGCQTCGTHISVTAWWIFSVRNSVELSRPVLVHRHGNMPICPICACPWSENLSNLAQIGSWLCGTHISETAGWIDPN